MKNIDKVREMTPEELIVFMKSDNCDRCTYNGTNCHSEFCTEGMTKWLEQDRELTIEDLSVEFNRYCERARNNNNSCTNCYYFRMGHLSNNECKFAFTVKNFNIADSKITRK